MYANTAIKTYDDELTNLDRMIAHMGGLAEENLGLSFDALVNRDPEMAKQVIDKDAEIDRLEKAIEAQAIKMIANREPKEEKLRHIMTTMRIASDLERVGDLGKNMAKRALAIANEQHPRTLLTGMSSMLDLALQQLKVVLDAYAERDTEKALAVWHSDRKIDAYYNSLFRELLTHMMEDPRNIGTATHLLFGAKNIERVGDHTTNIAENIYFLAKGTLLTESRPKADDTSMTLIRQPS
ncbi:MAG: phosphate signaling complex protein PhoU [Pseudomonadota bacterium]